MENKDINIEIDEIQTQEKIVKDKMLTLRATADEREAFKNMADKYNMSQVQFFKKILSFFIDNSNDLEDRNTEIQGFIDTITSSINLFKGSLEISKAKENSMKNEFNDRLSGKEDIILKYMEDNKKLKEQVNSLKLLEENNKELILQAEELNKSIEEIKDTNNTLNKYNKKLDIEIEKIKDNEIENIKLKEDIRELTLKVKNKSKEILEIEKQNKNINMQLTITKNELESSKKLHKHFSENIIKERDRLIDNIDKINDAHQLMVKQLREDNKSFIEKLIEDNKDNISKLDKAKNDIEKIRLSHDAEKKELSNKNDELSKINVNLINKNNELLREIEKLKSKK